MTGWNDPPLGVAAIDRERRQTTKKAKDAPAQRKDPVELRRVVERVSGHRWDGLTENQRDVLHSLVGELIDHIVPESVDTHHALIVWSMKQTEDGAAVWTDTLMSMKRSDAVPMLREVVETLEENSKK